MDSTPDAIATYLTRRFGLKGGLAWLGLLTFAVVAEQAKSRWEFATAENGTRDVITEEVVTTASGLQYVDKRIGGGVLPERGCIIGAHIKARPPLPPPPSTPAHRPHLRPCRSPERLAPS